MKISKRLVLYLYLSIVFLLSYDSIYGEIKYGLIVREPLKVYKSEDIESKVISNLVKGDKIKCKKDSSQSNFIKVKVTYNGKRVWAYVDKLAMRYSRVEIFGIEDKNHYQLKSSFGLHTRAYGNIEFKKKVKFSGEKYSVDESSTLENYSFGFNYYFDVDFQSGVFFSLASENKVLRGTLTDSLGESYEVIEKQNYYSLTINYKYYWSELGNLWFMGGISLGAITSQEYNVDGVSVSLEEGSLPGIIPEVRGAIGVDIDAFKPFYFPISIGGFRDYQAGLSSFGYYIQLDIMYQM